MWEDSIEFLNEWAREMLEQNIQWEYESEIGTAQSVWLDCGQIAISFFCCFAVLGMCFANDLLGVRA
jgi:hypothetical protein